MDYSVTIESGTLERNFTTTGTMHTLVNVNSQSTTIASKGKVTDFRICDPTRNCNLLIIILDFKGVKFMLL